MTTPYARSRRAMYARQKRIARPKWAYGEHSPHPIYRVAKARRRRGEDVNVDHIVPLFSPLVCGLHCKANLEVIHVKVNAKKSNFWWPDAPYEQTVLKGLMITWHQLGLL